MSIIIMQNNLSLPSVYTSVVSLLNCGFTQKEVATLNDRSQPWVSNIKRRYDFFKEGFYGGLNYASDQFLHLIKQIVKQTGYQQGFSCGFNNWPYAPEANLQQYNYLSLNLPRRFFYALQDYFRQAYFNGFQDGSSYGQGYTAGYNTGTYAGFNDGLIKVYGNTIVAIHGVGCGVPYNDGYSDGYQKGYNDGYQKGCSIIYYH